MAEVTSSGAMQIGQGAASSINQRRVLEKVGWFAVGLLVLVALTSVISRAVFIGEALTQPISDPGETFNSFDIRYYEHSLATILHLVPALLIIIAGPMQFVRAVRKRWTTLHRWCGRTFIVCGAVGAASGFFIGALYPFMGVAGMGFNQSMATVFFAVYILFCLYKAYTSIRRRQIGAHREWMIRSWVLMLAISTERILLGIFSLTTDVDMAVLFGTTFWMAGFINAAACEFWINLTRTPGNGALHWKDADAKVLQASS